jgi:hypothetical protein
MFLYSDFARYLIGDIFRCVPEFSHLVPGQVAVLVHRRAAHGCSGNYAMCYGLKNNPDPTFSVWVRPRSRKISAVSPWYVESNHRFEINGQQAKYLVSIRLPRMLKHDPLSTLVHELYHIGVAFDGSLRSARHGRAFDDTVERLRRIYLENADPNITAAARMNLEELSCAFGTVFCQGLPDRFRSALRSQTGPVESYQQGVARLYPGYRLEKDYQLRPLAGGTIAEDRIINANDCPLFACKGPGLEAVPGSYLRYARQYCEGRKLFESGQTLVTGVAGLVG